MQARRKTITLPSGATVTIRKLCGIDLVSLGEIPVPLPEDSGAGAAKKSNAADLARGVEITRLSLLKCTSRVSYPDGTKLRIVDKELDEVRPDEITIGELDDADAAEIIQQVNSLSGFTKEAGQLARPFPEGEAATGNTA